MREPQFREEGRLSRESGSGGGGSTPKEKDSFLSFLGELPVLVITAIVVAWVIKSFIVQPFYIPSSSMEPTLDIGDRVLVSKFSYRFFEPKPGDVVVFISPTSSADTEEDYIKRIVATPGMSIEVRGGKLFVNGRPKTEPYIRPESSTSNYGPLKVPKGKVFVMGDNRGNSKDSRYFGPIDKKKLLGKAFFIYWPVTRSGRLN